MSDLSGEGGVVAADSNHLSPVRLDLRPLLPTSTIDNVPLSPL